MEGKLDGFLRYLEVEKGHSPGTIEAYRLDVGRGLIPFLYHRGKPKLREVTSDDIRAYLDFLANWRNNSSCARARKLAAIKSFFNYLVGNGHLEASPAAFINSPKIAETEPICITDNECLRLLETVSQRTRSPVKERDIAIIVLLLHTGIRVSELVNLKLAHVDLEGGRMKVRRKGNREQSLYLNRETVNVLERCIAVWPESQDGRLFVTSRGSLNRIYVYRLVRRHLAQAGIDKGKRGPHLLRHTFCTRLHQKGIDPFVIRNLAGHKSLATTMRYVKIENKEQAEAIDKLEFGTLQGDTASFHGN